MNLLWFYKYQHDNQVCSKLFVACQRWWFQWRFWFVPSVQRYLWEEVEHKPDPWRNPIERHHMGLHLESEVAVVKTPTIISNNVYTPYIQIQYSKIPMVLVVFRLILILILWKLKFPAFYPIRRVTAAFTKPHQFFISYARRIQFKLPLLVSIRSIFILYIIFLYYIMCVLRRPHFTQLRITFTRASLCWNEVSLSFSWLFSGTSR